MNKFQKLSSAFITMILVTAVLISCKKDFDQPPVQTDPAIVANTTLKDLKARHTVGGAYDVITTDIIISGVVVADDKSGNLYKQIFIQDSTGGLQINLDAASLYGTFPVGRRVFIRCNGLTISDYNNTMQLGIKATVNGSPSLEAIPSGLISKYVIGGSLNNPVVAKVVTLSQLGTNMNDPYIGSLIQLNGFEFVPADTSKYYADTSVYKNAGDRYIRNCASATTIDVRSSGYSNFAAVKPAKGNGSILAIYTVYNSTKQLIIRDTSDVRFTNPRCNALTGTVLLNENFESQVVPATAPFNPVNISGWTNMAELGSRLWEARIFSANKFANQSAFGANQNNITTWLVTRAINLGTFTNKTLSFLTTQGFAGAGNSTAALLKVLISTNYTGSGTPWTATWTDITSSAVLSPGAASGFPPSFTSSGPISLNAYSGTVYIAFRYEGADPAGTTGDKTSTWEVDDVAVTGN
ncbi:MAG: DUF5689 domain-containing protein [Ferruginibacter sp.]